MVFIVDAELRTMKPSDLDNHVGEDFMVFVHAGNGKYDHWRGRLAGGVNEFNDFRRNPTPQNRTEGEGAEFYLTNVRFNGSRFPAEWRVPLEHGDWIYSFREDKQYIFIDESD